MFTLSQYSIALAASLSFGLIGCATNGKDDHIDLQSAVELLNNGDFKQGAEPWWLAGATFEKKGELGCVDFNKPGVNPWDVILGQSGITLIKGKSYIFKFSAKADKPTQIRALAQHAVAPYTSYLAKDINLTNTLQEFSFIFKPKADDEMVQYQFQMGGKKANSVCFGHANLLGPKPVKIKKNNINTVRINQVGYQLFAKKRATIASDSDQPLPWKLIDSSGVTLAEGQSQPFGVNESSGEKVHIVDFSQVHELKTDLVLDVDGKRSHPFRIAKDIYQTLKYDALGFYYQQRSGIDIEEAYVQRPELARPAGHKPELVSCFNGVDMKGNQWPGCEFTLDLTGGWYDAADHGKYVVNGGIAAWTLMNLYERSQRINSASKDAFADGKLKIPEHGNGVNDLLDEIRWEMNFLLAMQIPEGKKVWVPRGNQLNNLDDLKLTEIDASNLVFHKLGDRHWTSKPLPPHKDPEKRDVTYPSTAATLNMAATAAQCARVFKESDPIFSSKCLESAVSAWNSAKKYPDIYAYSNFDGSGPYDDIDVDDEFYWAAAELFTTTGQQEYLDFIKSSPLYLKTPTGGIDGQRELQWAQLSGAGTITLATVPNKLSAAERAKAQKNIISTADQYLKDQQKQGYIIPYVVHQYPWGSNGDVLNHSLFLGSAFDLTGNRTYIQAVSDSMDYILGRNPNDQSYITGYGARPLTNPLHLFWAHQVDKNSPKPPPGVMSGGPNSISFSDPIAQNMKGSCIGQTCWADESGSWTMNEVAINWNAPMLWVASFLDEGVLNNPQ